jgi:hypothetical protein
VKYFQPAKMREKKQKKHIRNETAKMRIAGIKEYRLTWFEYCDRQQKIYELAPDFYRVCDSAARPSRS